VNPSEIIAIDDTVIIAVLLHNTQYVSTIIQMEI